MCLTRSQCPGLKYDYHATIRSWYTKEQLYKVKASQSISYHFECQANNDFKKTIKEKSKINKGKLLHNLNNPSISQNNSLASIEMGMGMGGREKAMNLRV